MPTSETQPDPAVSSAPAVEEHFAVSHENTSVRVTLACAPDLPAVEALHALLLGLADGGREIVIDCSHAEHVSSAALQVLVAADAALAGRRLRIEAESAAVRDYLKLAGLDKRFPAAQAPAPESRKAPGKRKRSGAAAPQP